VGDHTAFEGLSLVIFERDRQIIFFSSLQAVERKYKIHGFIQSVRVEFELL